MLSFPFTHTPLRNTSRSVSCRIAADKQRSTETPTYSENQLNQCQHTVRHGLWFPCVAYANRVLNTASYTDLILSHVPRTTIDERSDMNEWRTSADTAQQNHCQLMEVHRSSIVCPWYIRIYAASYRKCDSSDDTKTELRTADERLTYPGTAPPGPHSEHRPQPGSRVSRQVCVPVGRKGRNLRYHTSIGRAHRIMIPG